MATQLKVGLGLAVGVVAAHAGYVIHARTLGAPQGKNRKFSPGSVDETVAFSLKTGDLILFQRECNSYALLSGLTCLSRQHRLSKEAREKEIGAVFDHVGVIVMKRGEPFVLEESTYGPTLRPYDERIKCSHSRKILLRPLKTPLPKPTASALEKWAKEVTGNDGPAAATMAGHPAKGSAARDHMAPLREFASEMRLLALEQKETLTSSSREGSSAAAAAPTTLRTVAGSSLLVGQALEKVTGPRRMKAKATVEGDEDGPALQDFWPPATQPFAPELLFAARDQMVWVRDLR